MRPVRYKHLLQGAELDIFVVEDRTYDWMFTLHAWNIKHAFYNGASLYDHDQVAIYKKALEDSKSKKRVSGRLYKYSGTVGGLRFPCT
jgi:hypothetical protein